MCGNFDISKCQEVLTRKAEVVSQIQAQVPTPAPALVAVPIPTQVPTPAPAIVPILTPWKMK